VRWEAIKRLPEYREFYDFWGAQIADATKKTREFIEMCEKAPVFMSPKRIVWGEDDGAADDRAASRFTLEDCFPELVARAREALLALEAERPLAKLEKKEEVGHLSRKFGDGRVTLAQELVALMRNYAGQPHYGVVCALSNVILDTDTDNEFTL